MTETVARPGAVAGARISALQQGYLSNRSDSVAALARLRRAVGKPPGSVFDVLDYTMAAEFVGDWRGDNPSWAEVAAHHAMTLYSVHQQSQRKPMHVRDRTLGTAVRRLIPESEYKPTHAVARRFAMLGTADSLSELIHHLRGIVQLLRTASIPIDYGRLTEDLVTWQRDGGPERVRLRWGRDFHLPPATPPAESE
ncbi:type I-E CRISPR-associated protein Cse2/CasB [Amycolatopsis sp. NPDC049868]|uniref:type I-E CRISPR-associated protein Cse2/CasB n=1 Tax=Amycolatopsis sp. NPDC049868 TaxID=3363934 RepID=UPI0037B131B1